MLHIRMGEYSGVLNQEMSKNSMSISAILSSKFDI